MMCGAGAYYVVAYVGGVGAEVVTVVVYCLGFALAVCVGCVSVVV